ncbi:MAG TPA: hypothetical protein VKV15_09435 [Bryobacteraceae bacterium]|nr:hypothetical protein [Bryobacteraceae bacterium]
MMAELVQKLSDKTGLSPEKSQEVVNVVVSHLKERLPAPLASGLDSILADGSGANSSSLVDEARAAASELSGMFGKKAGA